MRARAELIVTAPAGPGRACRVLRQRDAPPVAWRTTPDAVYVVGTAASPAGDDAVEMDVMVQPGARLRMRSAAATVAWPSTGTTQSIRAGVADRAALDWHLEPLIATAGCHHHQRVHLDLLGSARLEWTEEIILGRAGEQPGCLDLRLDVELDGRPLLRHQIIVDEDAVWAGPAILGSHRTLGIALRVQAGPSPEPGSGPGWARLELEGSGDLAVAVADDLPQLQNRLRQALGSPD